MLSQLKSGHTLWIASALFAALALSSQARANNEVYLEAGNVYGSNPFGNSDGGEFTALTNAGIPSGYAAAATYSYSGSLSGNTTGATSGFETFCVENSTYFVVDTTYNYSVSSDIQVPTPIAGGYEGDTGYTDVALSAGVAWLYQQFATGSLAGYDYDLTNTSADAATRNTDAGLLQQAIWDLQGASGSPDADPGTPALTTLAQVAALDNPYLTLVVDTIGLSAATSGQTSAGEYGVYVMNLYSGTNDSSTGAQVYQNQLIYEGPSSVPDSGATAMLLGIGLVLLVASQRNRLGLNYRRE